MFSSSVSLTGIITAALLALNQLVVPALAAPQNSFWQLLGPRQQQAEGTPLFLDEPSCAYYQCAIVYYPGDNATAHWLNAPIGNVNLTMISHFTNMTDQQVAVVPGITSNCDAEGSGNNCGQFSWIVPSTWAGGNFTLQAVSTSDSSIESYTDIILVKAGNATSNSANVAFSALDPTISGSSTVSVASSSAAPAQATTTSPSGTMTSAAAGAASTASQAAKTSSTAASSGTATNNASENTQVSMLLLSCTFALFVALCL